MRDFGIYLLTIKSQRTPPREQVAVAFAKVSGELQLNIAEIGKAYDLIKKGMGSSYLLGFRTRFAGPFQFERGSLEGGSLEGGSLVGVCLYEVASYMEA